MKNVGHYSFPLAVRMFLNLLDIFTPPLLHKADRINWEIHIVPSAQKTFCLSFLNKR